MSKQLTAKQQKFAELVIQGCSVADAMRGAGYSYKRPEDVANEGYRLLRHPDIAPMIQEARARAMEGAITTRRMLVGRLEKVNEAAYARLTDEDSEGFDREAFKAFTETYDRLIKMVPSDDFYTVANDELTAKNQGDIMANVFGEHVWFGDGEAAISGSWDSETVEPMTGGGVKVTRKRIR